MFHVKHSTRNKPKAADRQERLGDDLERLAAVLNCQGMPLSSEAAAALRRFIGLLFEWNRQINLVSRSDEDRVVSRHVTESLALLAVADFPPGAVIVDFGSGGGFPAIPIKIMRPDLRVTLVESVAKKTAFLATVARELGLQGLSVLRKRAESLDPAELDPPQIVTARAVATLPSLWGWAKAILPRHGALLALKGGQLENELAPLRAAAGVVSIDCIPFPTPFGVELSRCVVRITKG